MKSQNVEAYETKIEELRAMQRSEAIALQNIIDAKDMSSIDLREMEKSIKAKENLLHEVIAERMVLEDVVDKLQKEKEELIRQRNSCNTALIDKKLRVEELEKEYRNKRDEFTKQIQKQEEEYKDLVKKTSEMSVKLKSLEEEMREQMIEMITMEKGYKKTSKEVKRYLKEREDILKSIDGAREKLEKDQRLVEMETRRLKLFAEQNNINSNL